MITDDDIRRDCISHGNKNPTEGDIRAFRIFMKAAECEDAETIEEAFEKISISLDDETMSSPFWSAIANLGGI